MEEKQGDKGQSHKDHFHPKDSMERIDTADHDEFAHIPSGKGKDKARKKLVSDILGITGDDEQTKDEIHRKGKCSRECQNVHQTTFY
jgi:hypothetical protein